MKTRRWQVEFCRRKPVYAQRLLETPSFKSSDVDDIEAGLLLFFTNACYLRDVSTNNAMRNNRFFLILYNVICYNTYNMLL